MDVTISIVPFVLGVIGVLIGLVLFQDSSGDAGNLGFYIDFPRIILGLIFLAGGCFGLYNAFF